MNVLWYLSSVSRIASDRPNDLTEVREEMEVSNYPSNYHGKRDLFNNLSDESTSDASIWPPEAYGPLLESLLTVSQTPKNGLSLSLHAVVDLQPRKEEDVLLYDSIAVAR